MYLYSIHLSRSLGSEKRFNHYISTFIYQLYVAIYTRGTTFHLCVGIFDIIGMLVNKLWYKID